MTRTRGTWYNYTYIKDALGNITGIAQNDRIICRYRYDAFGRATTLNPDGTIANFNHNHIATINPFRWKSHYFDVESNYYYINGRYYDPTICSYITANSIENTLQNSTSPNSLSRYGVTLNNTVALLPATYTIHTVTKLSVDFHYQRTRTLLHRLLISYNEQSALIRTILVIAAITVAAVAVILTKGAAIPKIIKAAAKGAITGYIAGSAIGGIASALNGNNVWDGIVNGGINGFIHGAALATILTSTLAISNAIPILTKPANIATTQTSPTSANTVETQGVVQVKKWT
jgi:RHS repeat-associated protein